MMPVTIVAVTVCFHRQQSQRRGADNPAFKDSLELRITR